MDKFEHVVQNTQGTYYIISNKSNLSKIPTIVESKKNFVILKTVEIACQLKYDKSKSFIILAPECPLHPFKSSYKIENLTLKEMLNVPYEILEDEIKIFGENMKIDTDNEQIYNYFYYHNDLEPKFNLIDKTKFLISRLARIERSKEKKIFGIFFTSVKYETIADKIRIFLKSINKKVYKFYLRDINETRLNCFDGIECIIVIDCPFQHKFIDFHIPVLTPFEIQMAFGEWGGEYSINKFNLKPILSTDDKLVQIEYSTGKLIKYNQQQSVQYNTNSLPEILDGLDGIASGYETEIQNLDGKENNIKQYLIKLDDLKTAEIELKAVINLSKESYKIQKIFDRFYLLDCKLETIDLIAIRCFSVISIDLVINDEMVNNLKFKYHKFLENFKNFCKENTIEITEENMQKYDNKINHFCKCYWNGTIKNDIPNPEEIKKRYLLKYPHLNYLEGTKVFESFINENYKLLYNQMNPTICLNEGIKFIIPNTRTILEKNKLFEKNKFLVKHYPKRINPDRQYTVYLSFNLIAETFRIPNRSFFFKHEIKKQRFIGKTSMSINNSVLAINLQGLYKNNVYDPCCGAGSLLFVASLFGCLVGGTDLQKKQLVGFNEKISNVRTSLKGFNVMSNFKQFNTSDKVLFFGKKDIFSNDIVFLCEYIFTDLPYGIRSMKTQDIDEYMKKLKVLFNCSSVKGIAFWVEAGYNIENIFGVSKYKIQENLKTCQRVLYIFSK